MLIDRIYQKLLDDRGSYRLRPSNVFSCAEAHRRQLAGEKKEIPAKVLFSFVVGETLHERLVSELWKARGEDAGYIYLVSEKEVETAIGVGHVDLLVKEKDSGQTIVVDFKVVSDAHFEKVRKGGLEAVGIRYIGQLALYCGAVKTLKGLLVFVNKDSGEFLELRKEFSYEEICEYIEKARAIAIAVETNNVGEFAPLEEWECGYCSFAKECAFYKARTGTEAKKDIQLDEVTLRAIQEELDSLNEKVKWLENQKKSLIENISETYDGKLVKVLVTKSERTDWNRDELKRLVAPEILQRIETKKEVVTRRVILK